MAPETKDRTSKALATTRDMGFPDAKARPVLKELLRTCENNWKHIEDENYSLLIEALLGSESPKEEEKSSKRPYQTRLRERKQAKRPFTLMQSVGMSSEKTPKLENEMSPKKTQKPEKDDSPRNCSSPEKNHTPQSSVERTKLNARMESADTFRGQRSIGPLALYSDGQEMSSAEHSLVKYQGQNWICYKEPKIVVDLGSASENAVFIPEAASIARGELITGEPPLCEVPLAVVSPPPAGATRKEALDAAPSSHPERHHERVSPSACSSMLELNASLAAQVVKGENRECSFSDIRNEDGANDDLVTVVDTCSKNTVEISSSVIGDTKVSLTYKVLDCLSFQRPSLESIIKKVEDKCLRSYKILDPRFSLMNIMKEMCNTILELGTESAESMNRDLAWTTPLVDSLKPPDSEAPFGGKLAYSPVSSVMQLPQGPGGTAMNGVQHVAELNVKGRVAGEVDHALEESAQHIPEASSSLVLHRQHEPAFGGSRPVHDVYDIAKGEERVRISVVNEGGGEQYPPHFSYIPHNIVYQNAYLSFSLARIGDDNYCSDCFGDCLASSIPCACARETGGVYAYTLDGLLKKEFLDDCISMNNDPQKHRMFYCKDCPLERSKTEVKPDPCKGHLVRKFIKECWSKCGCYKQCGNRVVQRGITCNLQVFFTPEGKGWGLRALDDLPEGTFVCEYVGEVLTNMELYYRTIKTTGNAKHTYPVLLDADWGSEGVLKDEEALCLDATFYGNVARFINHRCGDANLLEVPVEVESPDHHYYHVAFFTTRKVEAYEELTWDYGIDFDDEDHPVKAFQCCCRSKLCRDRKRRNRTKSRASILK